MFKSIKNYSIKTFYILVRKLFHKFLSFRYKIIYNDEDNIKELKPPFVLVSNHVNFWDPVFIGIYLPHNLHFITSDHAFRSSIQKLVMKLSRSIPKATFVSDIQTVRKIMKTVKKAGCIGIFPEGRRSWDGQNSDLVPTVAKLIKKLKIPVVSAKIKGGYLVAPRWAKYSRKGIVEVDFKLLFTKNDMKDIQVRKINNLLLEAISHNEFDYQQKKMNKYPGKNLAEYLESLLFICPKCLSFETLTSSKNVFSCNVCNYSVVYDEYGFFSILDSKTNKTELKEIESAESKVDETKPTEIETDESKIDETKTVEIETAESKIDETKTVEIETDESKISENETIENSREKSKFINNEKNKEYINKDEKTKLYFKEVLSWNNWQVSFLKKHLENNKIYLSKENVILYTGYKSNPLNKFKTGVLTLNNSKLCFDNKIQNIIIEVFKISGLTVQYPERLEFYYDNVLYKISFPKQQDSVYRWFKTLDIITKFKLKK